MAFDDAQEARSSKLMEKIFYFDALITERAFECVSINFVVVGENNNSAVGVFHLDVATLAMNFCEAQSL
ncbi:MAG TPA: hypothetical protein VGW12_16780 [Pyrinomonadaceae bacterium]|nr:hypothetical protein [Pyrinomonadaceae bacterium]